jgi:hypothetical protein
MFTTIITDCKKENESARQVSRFNSSGLGPTTLIGIAASLDEFATIEAGCNLVDILDATNGMEGVILLNVAPRGDKSDDGDNGTPFCYFYHKKTLVVSTIKGYSLYFAHTFKLFDHVNLMDTKKTLEFLLRGKIINKELVAQIQNSQFRSFEFVPRVAKALIEKENIPFKKFTPVFKKPQPRIWCIDAFGNAKTTLVSEDLPETAKFTKTNFGNLKYYSRLKDIPKGKTAIYTGSSGFGNKRFLEIATQGSSGSAEKSLNVKLGDFFEIF